MWGISYKIKKGLNIDIFKLLISLVRPLNTLFHPNDVKSCSAGGGSPVINTGQASLLSAGFRLSPQYARDAQACCLDLVLPKITKKQIDIANNLNCSSRYALIAAIKGIGLKISKRNGNNFGLQIISHSLSH